VIFGCDGVLVDSEILPVEVDKRICADLGWELTTDDIVERFVGRSSADFAEGLTSAACWRRRARRSSTTCRICLSWWRLAHSAWDRGAPGTRQARAEYTEASTATVTREEAAGAPSVSGAWTVIAVEA
jgi:hypothetical protein